MEKNNNSISAILTSGADDDSLRKIFTAPAKQKLKFGIFLDFTRRKENSTKAVAAKKSCICKLCRAALKHTGSTTNLDIHATRKHSEEYGEFKTHNKGEHSVSTSQNRYS